VKKFPNNGTNVFKMMKMLYGMACESGDFCDEKGLLVLRNPRNSLIPGAWRMCVPGVYWMDTYRIKC